MTKLMWNRESGESKVFGDDETPGPEFIDHHPDDHDKDKPADAAPAPAKSESKQPDKDDPPKEKDMTKDEIIAALKEGQIEFDARAKKPELEALFINSMKHVLAAGDVEFQEDESARSLYGKLQAYLAERQPPSEE